MLQAREDRKRRLNLPGVYHVIEGVAPLLQRADVSGQKITVLAVERVEVVIEDLRGEIIVDAAATEMRLLQDAGDAWRQQLLAQRRTQGALGQGHAGNGRATRTGSREQQQAGRADAQR